MSRSPEAYEAFKDKQAEISRKRSQTGREIGLPPKCVKPSRRKATLKSLKLFCDTYLVDRFDKAWAEDQVKVAARLEETAIRGGLFALAMPRGSGKSTLCEAAVIWAICHAHRSFIVIIGATDDAAKEILDSVKMAFETNDLLHEDFPEICHPIRKLDGIANRAKGQTCGGVRTRITWTDKRAVFPTVHGSKASGARIHVTGIDGRIRGMKVALADGRTIRPDYALADDPQTDESAGSLMQIDKNERRLLGAVKGLAGPGKTIAMAIPCTVINPGDLSQRILDRKRHPQFKGEHMKLVYEFPKNEARWDEYAELRRTSQASDGNGEEATTYFKAHYSEMMEGAKVAWESRFDPETEVNAVQAAMNIKIDNPREFWSEYQNEPLMTALGDGARRIEPLWVASRLNGLERLAVPRDCTMITTFIDPGGYLIWHATVAWNLQYGGSVIDYGCWPQQMTATYTKANSAKKLEHVYRGMERAEYMHAGLTDLCNEIAGRVYIQDLSKAPMRCEQIMIDCGFEEKVVKDFIKTFPFGYTRAIASRGKARSSAIDPVGDWRVRPGEWAGMNCKRVLSKSQKGFEILFDPDAWKSFVYERWATPIGGRSVLKLYGQVEAGKQPNHELFAAHQAAEYGRPKPGKGSVMYEKWEEVPAIEENKSDNDWLDCVVGAAVAANVAGLKYTASASVVDRTPKKRLTQADIDALQANRKILRTAAAG